MHGLDTSIILGLLCFALLAPYVLGPIAVWALQRQPVEPQLEPFELDDPDLPREAATYFHATSKVAESLGFEFVAGFALAKQTRNVKAVTCLWANRVSKQMFHAACLYTSLPASLRLAYLSINTRFRDGAVFLTNNSTIVGAFPRRPGFRTQSFPMIKDPARLYRLHQARSERHPGGADKVFRFDEEFHGSGAAYLARSIVEELEDATAAGYWRLSPDGESYRPTVKGALLMTWGQCWPIKAIRTQHRARAAQRLLAEIETAEVDLSRDL